MKLTSEKIRDNEMIPRQYTCAGEDINPPFKIVDIPKGTQSLAFIVDDPDAPNGTFTHWVVYNIPVISEIKENSIPGTSGVNDCKNVKYSGPCPPSGTHHYHFKLFALDIKLLLPEGQTRAQIEEAMQGHILAEADVIGLFKIKAKQPVG